MHPTARSTRARFLALGASAALLAAACSSTSATPAQSVAGATDTSAPVTAATAAPTQAPQSAAPVATSTKTLQLAYLSFAVANSYDAPMLAAAKAAASAGNAQLTVFDANNDPATQTKQLQDAVASGKYDGIVLQPIYGAGLVTDVKNAIAKGVPVGNIDQILGADFTTANSQVDGLSANVVFVPSEMGTKMGELTVQACQAKNANPCKVGYIYSVKASGLDGALYTAFTAAIAKGTNIQVVAQGESFYQV